MRCITADRASTEVSDQAIVVEDAVEAASGVVAARGVTSVAEGAVAVVDQGWAAETKLTS